MLSALSNAHTVRIRALVADANYLGQTTARVRNNRTRQ